MLEYKGNLYRTRMSKNIQMSINTLKHQDIFIKKGIYKSSSGMKYDS